MKLRTHLFIVVMLLVTAFSYAGTLPTYDVVELMQMEGNAWAQPYSLNNNEQIAGSLYNLVDFKFNVFLWDNMLVDHKNIVGIATNINDNGYAVGQFNDQAGNLVGFKLLKDKLELLETLGGNDSCATGININEQIIGRSKTTDGITHACLWESGEIKNLGNFGGRYSCAIDINDKGHIVGSSETEAGIRKAFLYKNGEMHDLGIEGAAVSINESEQIIVYRINNNNKRDYYLWENGNLIEIIKNLEITDGPVRINDNGQVYIAFFSLGKGLIWSKETGTIDVNTLLPDDYFCSPDTDGDINDKGEIVCKVYKKSAHRYFMVLLVPSSYQTVFPPQFSIEPGMYSRPIEVKVTCATENAVIHYTTNGIDPTEADPVVESGGTVLIDKDTILKAKAWRSDCKASSVQECKYLIRQKSWKGLAMVSVPTVPSNSDPKLAVGFSNNYWYAYNPVTRSYAGYPEQYTWFDISKDNSTRAFWAKFNTETPVPEGKYPFSDKYLPSAVQFKLEPGWNMIGQPFISTFKWDTSNISVKAGNSTTGIYNAVLKDAGEYVQPYIWGWKTSVVNPNTGAYYRVGDPSVYPDAVDTMEPFAGYWIRAKKECIITIYSQEEN